MAKSGRDRERLGEFGIIARYFAPLATDSAALGLRDDTAVLRPPEGQEIVLSCDTIVEGVHFRKDDPPYTIAHKALAVNLSDLAAKGARPYVYLLALSLAAEPLAEWLEGFAKGLRVLQERSGVTPCGRRHHKGAGPHKHHRHRARARAAGSCRAAPRREARRPALCERHDRRRASRPAPVGRA